MENNYEFLFPANMSEESQKMWIELKHKEFGIKEKYESQNFAMGWLFVGSLAFLFVCLGLMISRS